MSPIERLPDGSGGASIMTTPTNSDPLRKIAERTEKATPGPWYPWCFDEGIGWSVVAGKPDATGEVVADLDFGDTTAPQEPNAEFIAAAREDIPFLLSEVNKLKAERAETIEVLIRCPSFDNKLQQKRWWENEAKPLLDKLKGES